MKHSRFVSRKPAMAQTPAALKIEFLLGIWDIVLTALTPQLKT